MTEKDNKLIHAELRNCINCGKNTAIIVIRTYIGFIKGRYWCDSCGYEDTFEY